MRPLAGAAAVLLLLLLLTWLLLRGIETDEPKYAGALRAFNEFALAEASLHRDILEARSGLLRNYDPINNAIVRMNDAVAGLRIYAKKEGLNAALVERLGARVAEQEAETERFKSSNALLQNSLSYFGLISTSPEFASQEPTLAPATGALAAAVLHLSLDSSPTAVDAVQQRLDELVAQAPSTGPRSAAAQALVAHARLLHMLLPTIDQTLKTLVAEPSNQPLQSIRAQFADRHAVGEATAQRFRLLLYAVSLLLLGALVRLGLKLRARASALRRRAAFEHVIAENSTRLINSPPAETEARLKQVLGDIGRTVGVERAYVVLAENPIRVHAWSADGSSYPAGWPDGALALSARIGAPSSDIVTIPDVAALPPSEFKDALAAMGVRAWGCVPLIRPSGVRGIMGFDTFQPARDKVLPLPVVQLAGDVVANAIERESLERDRARLAMRLESARRMETIGQLASGVAHNFNNIIGAILGYSELAEGELTAGTNAARHVDEIRSAAERGRHLIDNVLTFGRRRDARPRTVLVQGLLGETASLLRASLPQGVELTINDMSPDIAVSGESVQLQQIILNLCHNAAQAMDGKGRIGVAADKRELVAPLALSHGELAPGSYVCLAVSDTGPGMDESVARRLFEPFFTTRPAGTGLGLATVREIVRDHEGAINVVSAPGQGSRFEAWLPAADADAALKQQEAQLPLGRGEAILVLENEHQRLLGDEEMLAALGYEPVGFTQAADAFAACRVQPARFDAMLISHASAPEACDLARTLHEIAPQKPILLATSSAIDIGVGALTNAGVTELLRRPLVSTDLAAALARCLRSPATLRM